MPWKIVEGGPDCPYEVVKEGSGERVACHPTEEAAKKHMAALYAHMPPSEREAPTPLSMPLSRAPIEFRDAQVGGVNFAQRVITVIAVPWEQPALVPFKGDIWQEMFLRGAFDGIEKRPNRVRANREHDRSRTFGKVIKFYPQRDEGLVAEVRCAQTLLGDETLALADEDCLSASVGFGVKPADQILDRMTKTRRIKTAYLDHLAFVESPAYVGADVLSVRGNETVFVDPTQRVATPNMNQAIADMRDLLQWQAQQLH